MPNERLAYAWKGGHEGNVGYGSRLDTVVTWILSRVENGTRLRLVHSGFVMPKNDTAFKNMSEAGRRLSETSAPSPTNRIPERTDAIENRRWSQPRTESRRRRHERGYTGGCACGAIRYEISAEPMFDERLPVSRLSARERHRARIPPDLSAPA